jgi:hypothetical protein
MTLSFPWMCASGSDGRSGHLRPQLARTAAGLQVSTTPVRDLDSALDVLVAPALGVRQSATVVEIVADAARARRWRTWSRGTS